MCLVHVFIWSARIYRGGFDAGSWPDECLEGSRVTFQLWQGLHRTTQTRSVSFVAVWKVEQKERVNKGCCCLAIFLYFHEISAFVVFFL